MITVVRPGLVTSVMDLGRPGYQRHGVVVGGALDRFSARVANLIVGNHDGAALLEFAQLGPELHFARETLVAWCGADFDARIGREPLPRDRAVRVGAGETIQLGTARSGLRGWLAVAGGFDVPPVLGSRSTYRRAGIGGFRGRRLQAGDELSCGLPGAANSTRLKSFKERASAWTVRPETLGRGPSAGAVRAIPGPEWDWFTPDGQVQFFGTDWRVTKDADRMGIRLDGPSPARRDTREMISEAAPEGGVQVPAGGPPIVLLASRQTLGGYPRIAVVATVDLGRLAQLAPGTRVRFEAVTLALAHDALLARERDLQRVRHGLERLGG